MDLKEIAEKILVMEAGLDLFDRKIGDVHYWELIRFGVVVGISRKTGVYGEAHSTLKQDAGFGVGFARLAAKNVFSKNPFRASGCDILFLGHPRRKRMADGLWWDIYCDPVIERLESRYRCVLLESPYMNTHFTPCKTRNIRYLDLVRFMAALNGIVRHRRVSLPNAGETEISEIRRAIRETFDIEMDVVAMVREKLWKRKSILPLYLHVLKQLRPKLAVVLIGYGNKFFVEACKMLSIPVAELQHGIVGRYHLGYSHPTGKEMVRAFPDYFLTFGDYWKNIVSFPIPRDNVFSAGYPFFEMETARYAGEGRKDQVLFISQGTIGEKMSRFAVALAKRIDFTWEIVYKLHPGECDRWRMVYPWLAESGVRVIDDDAVPLYRLLVRSKALVGVYSTVVYEGLGAGLRTFLLDLPGVEHMDELVTSGRVDVISTVDALLEGLGRHAKGGVDPDYFFKPHALNNIEAALTEIMQREGKA